MPVTIIVISGLQTRAGLSPFEIGRWASSSREFVVNGYAERGSWRAAFEVAAPGKFLTAVVRPVAGAGMPPLYFLTLEALFAISGMRPHGLVVGIYRSTNNPLSVEVHDSGAFALGEPTEAGPLDRPLHIGLPSELADAASAGIRRAAAACGLRSGCISLVGGGIDSESSPAVFDRLGQAAAWAFKAQSEGSSLQDAMEAAMVTW
jgi:hypothetical protein